MKKYTISPIRQTITVGYKKTQVYNFSELPEKVQNELVEDFDRDSLSDDFFDFDIDFLIDEIINDAYEKYALPITRIPYDLSYTQGSGATFVTDNIVDNDLRKFLEKSFPDFVKSFRFPVIFDYFIESSTLQFMEARYTNYNKVFFETCIDVNIDNFPHIEDSLSKKAYELEKILDDFSYDVSVKITSRLYDAYEQYTSDENVECILEENNYYLIDGTSIDPCNVRRTNHDL